MELFSRSTRFAFACNNSEKIIGVWLGCCCAVEVLLLCGRIIDVVRLKRRCCVVEVLLVCYVHY